MPTQELLSPYPATEIAFADSDADATTIAYDDVFLSTSTVEQIIASTTKASIEVVNSTVFSEAFNSTQKIDLQALWKWLEQGHSLNNIGNNGVVVGLNEANLHDIEANKASVTTWQLAIIQGVLLAMLVVLSVLWAFCCKRLRSGDQPLMAGISEQVVALARKISNGSSRDLPPSYSKVDLTQVGLTINDHLNPPPHYDVVTDDEMIGDLRRQRRRISRFSLASLEAEAGIQPPPSNRDRVRRISDRVSVDNELPGIIRSTRTSVSSNYSDSESASRRTSRVTFAPNLESGPTRRESSQSLPLQPALVSKSRKSSAHSEGSAASRRVSFIDELTGRSARPDPMFEERLRSQLEIVKEAGEMGEFMQTKPSCDNNENKLEKDSCCKPEKETNRSEITVAIVSAGVAPVHGGSTIQTTKADVEKEREKSSCHIPEEDLKTRELFI